MLFDLTPFPPAPGGGANCELTAWPEFHAGASGGLRITPTASRLVRTWLLLRKPPEATFSHAGVLFALGLRGELRPIAPGNLYRYLSQEHLATTVGVLLGLGASFRGTQVWQPTCLRLLLAVLAVFIWAMDSGRALPACATVQPAGLTAGP